MPWSSQWAKTPPFQGELMLVGYFVLMLLHMKRFWVTPEWNLEMEVSFCFSMVKTDQALEHITLCQNKLIGSPFTPPCCHKGGKWDCNKKTIVLLVSDGASCKTVSVAVKMPSSFCFMGTGIIILSCLTSDTMLFCSSRL